MKSALWCRRSKPPSKVYSGNRLSILFPRQTADGTTWSQTSWKTRTHWNVIDDRATKGNAWAVDLIASWGRVVSSRNFAFDTSNDNIMRQSYYYLTPRWTTISFTILTFNLSNFSRKVISKISTQPHTIVKQICFTSGNVLFKLLFSLSKN